MKNDFDFDLNLLPIAVSLYETKSVSDTATRLGLSQPAVSMALATLRRFFDDELFVKTRHGMVPTPAGRSLMASSRDILIGLNEHVLGKQNFDPATTQATFSFAMTEVGELLYLPVINRELRHLAPNSRTRSVCPPRDELLRGLENGAIDLALRLLLEVENSGSFYKQKLFGYEIACLMRAGHPFKGSALSLRQYKEFTHVDWGRQSRTALFWQRLFQRECPERKVSVVTAYIAGLPKILETSDAVATVSRPAAIRLTQQSNNRLKVVAAPFKAHNIVVNQYWHRSVQSHPKHRWLRKTMKSMFKDESDLYSD